MLTHQSVIVLMLNWAILSTMLMMGSVSGHGFIVSPTGSVEYAKEHPSVRNYGAIKAQIDDLRNPVQTNVVKPFEDSNDHLCRRAPASSQKVPITLINGAPHTVVIAFSKGAFHTGPCRVEIMNKEDGSDNIAISDDEECAQEPVVKYGPIPGTGTCYDRIPKDLGDQSMCLTPWTFQVKNADKITCGDNCILRWRWSATHRVTQNEPSSIEQYENCIDVSVTVKNASEFSPTNSTSPDPHMITKTVTEIFTFTTPVTSSFTTVFSSSTTTITQISLAAITSSTRFTSVYPTLMPF